MKNKNKPIRPIFNWVWLLIITLALAGLTFVTVVSAYDLSAIYPNSSTCPTCTTGLYVDYNDAILIPMMTLAVILGISAFFTFLHTIKSFKMEAFVRSLEVFYGKKREIQ